MPPKRIMFIRHAEKPGVGNNDRGVAADGEPSDESLTVRGWQRAGALIALFCARPEMRPNTIFASGVGHESKSRRPIETVTPLAGALNNIQPNVFITTHLLDDLQPLMDEVLSQEGTVLVSWEHKKISKLVAMLPNAPPFRRTGRTIASIWSGYSTVPARDGPFRKCRNACCQAIARNRSHERLNRKEMPFRIEGIYT